MEYRAKLESIINETSGKRDLRNQELFEYSRRRFAEYDALKEQGCNSLTRLPGLRVFFYEAGEMIAANPDKFFAVIVMDIAEFKAVNEFCGRKGGDDLLFLISDLFKKYENERPNTIAGHARADNFLMCTAFEDDRELIDIALNMYDVITTYPFAYKVQPSFGICPDYEPLPSVSYLKDCATIAMKSIKGKFYAKYSLFDEQMRKDLLKEKQVENDIINALESEQLKLFIQPKVDMRTGEIIGGESLVRWQHDDMGMIPPIDFIPVLEKNGFIINVDYFMWEQVFKYLSKLKGEGRRLIPISINISRVHVHDLELSKRLVGLSEKYRIPPSYVTLELTESAFEHYETLMFEQLEMLRSYGFKISMDDFGTGYSSLQMLASTPLDEIKIDRGFIISIENPKSRVILESIINMLKGMEVNFIVEGVETELQKDILLSYGCYDAQGFMFYKPMPVDQFDKLI